LSEALAILWAHRDTMLAGLLMTLQISACALVLALVLGTLLFGLSLGARLMQTALTILIDTMRCVPFLLFLYLIYYGLPAWGIVLDNFTAGICALTLYNAAYFAELMRGAYRALPVEEIEAGRAIGFHGPRLIWRIVLPPLIATALPAMGNQAIQIVKDSAFLLIITVQELTFAANEIQATYYVPLASFVCAALGYWLLCLGIEAGVRGINGRALAWRT
jgi:polar amino acid transport system permease protein